MIFNNNNKCNNKNSKVKNKKIMITPINKINRQLEKNRIKL